jgi:hypothetical protein
MKKWFKKITVGDYDILVQRLCDNKDGEHIKITIRVPEGQMMKTLSFDDEENDAEVKADEAFKLYDKEQAKKFVEAFEEMYNAHDDTQEENNDKKD